MYAVNRYRKLLRTLCNLAGQDGKMIVTTHTMDPPARPGTCHIEIGGPRLPCFSARSRACAVRFGPRKAFSHKCLPYLSPPAHSRAGGGPQAAAHVVAAYGHGRHTPTPGVSHRWHSPTYRYRPTKITTNRPPPTHQRRTCHHRRLHQSHGFGRGG